MLKVILMGLVLKANDWISEVLSEEALEAVRAADKKIKIREWDLE